MDRFEQLGAELETAIANESAETPAEADGLVKAVTQAARDFLNKGKKTERNESDLTDEEGVRSGESLLETEEDPARKPVPAGKGYPKVGRGIRKSVEEEFEDECDDDCDETPQFFGKSIKKSRDDSDEIDATEYMQEMGAAVQFIAEKTARLEKATNELMKAQALFGQLLADVADPRRDKLLETMAKAMNYIVTENKEIKKSVAAQADLAKSFGRVPSAPIMAGMIPPPVAAQDTVKKAGDTLSKADKDSLFGAVNAGRISMDQYRQALATGDLSCVRK